MARRTATPVALAAALVATAALVTGCAPTTGAPAGDAPASTPTPATSGGATTPAPEPSRPTALAEADAEALAEPFSVVWLATSTDVDSLEGTAARVELLGYEATMTPVACLVPTPADLLAADDEEKLWGVPVYFADAADAELFVGLWDAPVAAVVHDVGLACGWG